jgi:hypothetical protein
MSQLISRILLTVLLFPSAALVLVISFIFAERLLVSDDETALFFSALVTCAYMIMYWLLLWRRVVAWTPRRVRMTAWAAGGAAIAGTVLGVVIKSILPYDDWLGGLLGSLAGTLLWIGATILIWRETPAERSARLARAGADTLVCPTCGYNLTGLSESRCPECGAQFTLSELYAAQPARAGAEIEAG